MERKFASDRAIGWPAHCVTPLLAESVVSELANELGFQPGPITDAYDPRIQAIVDNWPLAVDGTRATALGLPSPPPLQTIVKQYLEDFGKR